MTTVRRGSSERGPSGASAQGNAEMGRLARTVAEIVAEHEGACGICQAGTRCWAATLLWRCVSALQAERRQVLDDVTGRCQGEQSR